MGILNKLFTSPASVQQLPSGTITVNRQGRIITSTVSSQFPLPLVQAIANGVLELFKEARSAQEPLSELSLHYSCLRITARELRGGAIIFMFPQTASPQPPTPARS